MSEPHEDDRDGRDDRDEQSSQDEKGTAVSEGGSAALNADTSQGGADSVPDTPDVNTGVSDAVDVNEPSQEGAAEGEGHQPG
jgi:hypothetical protein